MRNKYLFLQLISLNFLFCSTVYASSEHDTLLYMVEIDQLEQRYGDQDATVLEAQAWVGKDLNKVWIKTEAEYADSDFEELELQLLYSRAISPYWNIELGARRDFKPEPERNWAAIGLHGLAPYFFEIDTTFFVGQSGRTALRFKAEYEIMLTQRWVLVPEVELNFYGKTDEATGTGSGLADSKLGLRVGYEIRREFAPYVGLHWENKYGKTKDFAQEEGESSSDTQLVIGIRAWF